MTVVIVTIASCCCCNDKVSVIGAVDMIIVLMDSMCTLPSLCASAI